MTFQIFRNFHSTTHVSFFIFIADRKVLQSANIKKLSSQIKYVTVVNKNTILHSALVFLKVNLSLKFDFEVFVLKLKLTVRVNKATR